MTETVNEIELDEVQEIKPEFQEDHLFVLIENSMAKECLNSKWDMKKHSNQEMMWIDCTVYDPAPKVGDYFDKDTLKFTTPPAPIKPTTITASSFKSRFTSSEYKAFIKLAFKDVDAMVLLSDINTNSDIDLDGDDAKSGLAACVTNSVFVKARADEILKP